MFSDTKVGIGLEGVSAGYRVKGTRTTVLHDITVSIRPGLSVLIGPNGAGKTTLFRVAAGILSPWSGRVVRDDDALVGYSSHRSGLLAKLSVRDNVTFWAKMLGDPASTRVDAVLGEAGVSDLAGQLAATLSRGQAQRVSIARALLADPSVLLLDEPLAGVDPGGVKLLLDLFTQLAAAGRSVVVSSHSLAALAGLDAAVIALREGRLVAQGGVDELSADLKQAQAVMRLRGADGLFDVLARGGFDVRREADGAVVLTPSAGRDTAAAIAEAARHGIAVSEASPVRDRLSQIYDALEAGGE